MNVIPPLDVETNMFWRQGEHSRLLAIVKAVDQPGD